MAKRLFTRRAFIKTSAMGAISSGAVFGYTWRIEPHWVQVVERELPISALPESLSGKRLVQLSDLHVGPVVDQNYLTRSMDRVNELSPDLLVVTGDLMSCRDAEQIEPTIELFKEIHPPSLATIVVLGNHDYGYRWGLGRVADRLSDRLRQMDVIVLRNETTRIEGLTIAGIDDYWSPRFGPEPMLSTLDPEQANLVLCHNPDVADEPVWNGYQGWILCGHTHGGQCRPPFLNPPILPVENKRYTEGEIDLYDGRIMYINRGLGYMHRVRFNVRPEITVFTLKKA